MKGVLNKQNINTICIFKAQQSMSTNIQLKQDDKEAHNNISDIVRCNNKTHKSTTMFPQYSKTRSMASMPDELPSKDMKNNNNKDH
eukprot:scaffold10764_cov159-Ochromonas_danica.AAC.46